VFCPKCGAQNADGAAFCSNCGASLSASPQAPSPPTSGPTGSGSGKSPFVAAFLNLFFGLGYVYLGTRRVLGVPTIAFMVIALVIYILLGIFTAGIVTVIFAIVLAVDGWQKGSGGKGFVSAD
jgi:zinc-ribbon domain